MNTRQVGKRCNVKQRKNYRIESDEIEGRTTLATLEKNCAGNELQISLCKSCQNDGMIEFIEKTAEEKAKNPASANFTPYGVRRSKISIESMKEQIHFLREELLKTI